MLIKFLLNFHIRQTLVEEDDQATGADIPVIKFELEPEPSDAKITNSPSSITTTTYSTHSTLGTVATDNEISEGEQLQVCETFYPWKLCTLFNPFP